MGDHHLKCSILFGTIILSILDAVSADPYPRSYDKIFTSGYGGGINNTHQSSNDTRALNRKIQSRGSFDQRDDTCTMEKVLRQSGTFSNEGVMVGLQFGLTPTENCEDESTVKKRCEKLNRSFYKNFRTLEGQCNNNEQPLLGSTRSRLSRLLPADHKKFRRQTFFDKPENLACPEDDCDNECQKESDKLPNPRRVSTQVAEDMDRQDTSLSLMAVFFGQFLDHELALSPEHEVEESCCEAPANGESKDEECFEILIPPDDPFYSSLNQSCIHLTRSEPHSSSGWPPSIYREQQNIVTSFLDGSNIYGSTAERSKRIRSMVKGKLKVMDEYNLLPEENFQRCTVPIAGDERAMENPLLGSIHALFVREHNRICDQLWPMIDWTHYGNKDCDNDECDELMYQNARRVLIAEWQNIIYNEWLPLILGNSRMSEFNLDLDSSSAYDNTIDPSILVSFTTAAFRFGHSMVMGTFSKNSITNGDTVEQIILSDSFFNAEEYRKNGMEMILAGLQTEKAQRMDRFVSKQLTNFLFKDTDGPSEPLFGQDLISRNIARGRDHGLPGYAKFYKRFGPQTDPNRSMKCWDERPQAFDSKAWNLLKEIYIHPKDIDLFIGGLLEKKLPNKGILGPMFGYIVAEQFRRLKDGDRFFFTHQGNDHSFSSNFVNSIKKRRMSDLLCDNTFIRNVNTNAFLSTSDTMDCSQTNSLDFAYYNLLLLPTKKCSAGYEYKRGDINGFETVEYGLNASLEECGERCLQNLACNSYEHDAGKRQCNLYKELEPNAGRHGNFVFCKKSGHNIDSVEEGTPCGACFNPATNYQCGPCSPGLECVQHPPRDPYDPQQPVHESFGECRRLLQEGQACGPCFNPSTNNQCGTCGKGLQCATPKLTQLQRTGLVQSVCVKLSTGNLEGAPCGACCNPTSNNQCGDCAEGLQCVPNLRDPDDSFPIVFEPFGTCKSSSGSSEACYDIWDLEKCTKKKRQEKCDKGRVAKNCKKTCDLCEGSSEACYDIWDFKKCTKKKRQEKCNKRRVARNCKKTCDLCEGEENGPKPQWRPVSDAQYFGSDLVIIICVSMISISLM